MCNRNAHRSGSPHAKLMPWLPVHSSTVGIERPSDVHHEEGRPRDASGTPSCDFQPVGTLLVASAGGHLEELWALRPRLQGISEDVTWVTWANEQTRSLLRDEEVVYVAPAQPRDVLAAAKNLALAARLLRARAFDTAVSTGSSLAVSFLPIARLRGTHCHYIESATRVGSPSVSAKLLERVPGINFYTQYRNWSQPRWLYRGSVFDPFTPGPSAERPIRRAVVTVGTAKGFGFRRLVEAVRRCLDDEVEVLWQTGSTDVSSLGISARKVISSDDLFGAIEAADVVVAHAGAGSSLAALRAGKCPLLVPRRAAFGEHVDDHQVEIATELEGRELAIKREAHEISREDLALAAARSTVVRPEDCPFILAGAASPAPGAIRRP